MRTIGIFLIFFFFSGKGEAQETTTESLISLSVTEVQLKVVLAEITSQSGLEFSFNANKIDTRQTISLNLQKVKLSEALEQLSKQIYTEHSIIEGIIILRALAAPEPTYTLSGFLEDANSGESLIGASVFIAGSSKGAVTNAFGYYAIDLKPGKVNLVYSYVGYEMQKLALDINGNQKQNLRLKASTIDLPDVIVELPLSAKLSQKHAGQKELKPETLLNLPEFAGESGLIKGLQSQPGIKTHSDGSAFFYSRGGEKDQNLIIIDDAPIYNPAHLFGFYSIVIPEFTKSIRVYNSDIPTNIGDRLSSIISIRTKDGNLNKFVLSGAINPLVYRLSLETPIAKKKGSIFASFRRSNFEWLYKRNSPNANISFGDLNFKWNLKVNDKNRLYFTTIYGADNFSNSADRNSLAWANFAASFRWNHIVGPKLFSNTTLYTGTYGYRLSLSENFWRSSIGTVSLKSDFTHYINDQFKAKFGGEIQGYYINPGEISADSVIGILPQIDANRSNKLTLYYNGTYDFNDRLKLNAGLRMVNWNNTGATTYYQFDEEGKVQDTIFTSGGVYNNYLRLDPRLSLQYQIDSSAQAKFSVGVYHQYLQLISDSESPFSTFEVWLSSSPNIRPQSAIQFSGSYLKYFQKSGLEFSAAAYYKHYGNQIDYVPHANTLLNPLVEGELLRGKMRSWGIELLLQKNLGRLTGAIGYTYSRAQRQTPGINGGARYPAYQDRPQEFSLMLNYLLSKRVHFSAYWTAYTGSAFSSPTGFFQYNGQTVPIFDQKNNDRLPDYRRLDISFKFILNKKPEARFQHSLNFSIYNALAHKNIVFVNFNKIPREGDSPIVKSNVFNNSALVATQNDLIRFFPSLTYKFKL